MWLLWFMGAVGLALLQLSWDRSKQQKPLIAQAASIAYAQRSNCHSPAFGQQSAMSFATGHGRVQQYIMTIAFLQDCRRLVSFWRGPTAHGGPQQKSAVIHKRPSKSPVIVAQYKDHREVQLSLWLGKRHSFMSHSCTRMQYGYLWHGFALLAWATPRRSLTSSWSFYIYVRTTGTYTEYYTNAEFDLCA